MKLKKLWTLVAVVLCFCMVTAPVASLAGQTKNKTKTAGEYFSTSISSYRDEVSVSVKLAKNSKLTSGKVVLYYDPSVLKAEWYSDDDYLGLVDVNTNYEAPEGMAAISYAWASETAVKSASTVLTVDFTVRNAKNGQKISVETAVLEAFNESGPVTLSEENTVTSATISIPKTLVDKIIGWIGWIFG